MNFDRSQSRGDSQDFGGFTDLPLNDRLLGRLEALSYNFPTEIQEAAIPIIMNGRDLRAHARTGTGKTAAYALPIIARLEAEGAGPHSCIVLAPSRELAQQISREFKAYLYGSSLKVGACYGQMRYERYLELNRQPPHILVATPGKLAGISDVTRRFPVDISNARIIVLDEYDKLLGPDQFDEVNRILSVVPPPMSRQTLLFSATTNREVQKIADDIQNYPESLDGAVREPLQNLSHFACVTQRVNKLGAVTALLTLMPHGRVIVFTETRRMAEVLVDRLSQNSIPAGLLHGKLLQEVRENTLSQFAADSTGVLVATDVIGRGIHIPEISHVVLFDAPATLTKYTHRAGRGGRLDNHGMVITLGSKDELLRMRLRTSVDPLVLTLRQLQNVSFNPQEGLLAAPEGKLLSQLYLKEGAAIALPRRELPHHFRNSNLAEAWRAEDTAFPEQNVSSPTKLHFIGSSSHRLAVVHQVTLSPPPNA
ncbi:MAG: DEAD/DEAH box helicase, partial [Bdellovibrionales bacterium]|nr:DEAD/DEAH box helicase [Bdellovibrionales bacterium]